MSTLHVYSNRHIKDQVKSIQKHDWVFLENGMSKNRWSLYFRKNGIKEESLDITYITQEEYFDLTGIKFDAIVGNPPYQDGTKEGGQNKIYMLFCKKAFELLSDSGTISFITPASALKQSKRFSLVGTQGLKVVDFTADKHFSEGIKICSWTVDKTYTGDVTVIHNKGENKQSKDVVIYDYAEVDKDFAELYEALKSATDTPKNRMFKQNAVDTTTGRSFEKSEVFQYPVYKIENGSSTFVQYNKPKPKFFGETKFVISMTKGFGDNAIIIDTKDYDVAHLSIKVDNDEQVDNIKMFIFSDYFKTHSEKWKNLDGYGYNYALKHLPVFDINKTWTNDEVKEFIESYAR